MMILRLSVFHVKCLVFVLLPLAISYFQFRQSSKINLIASTEVSDFLRGCNLSSLMDTEDDDKQVHVLEDNLIKTTVEDTDSVDVKKVANNIPSDLGANDLETVNMGGQPSKVEEKTATATKQEEKRVRSSDSQSDTDKETNKTPEEAVDLTKVTITEVKNERQEDKHTRLSDSQPDDDVETVETVTDEDKNSSKTKDTDQMHKADKTERQKDKHTRLSDSQPGNHAETVEAVTDEDENSSKTTDTDQMEKVDKTERQKDKHMKRLDSQASHEDGTKEAVNNEYKDFSKTTDTYQKQKDDKIENQEAAKPKGKYIVLKHKTLIQNLLYEPIDTEEYRSGYPNLKDKKNLKENIHFLTGKIKSKPNGDKIDDIHKNWWGNYALLERHHGYVQWLFPIRTEGMNFESQALQLHELKELLNGENKDSVQKRILKSLEMMLDFYGMKIDDEESGKLSRSSAYEERYESLLKRSHNNLRITRILKCLGEFDMEKYQIEVLEFFIHEAFVTGKLAGLGESLTWFWIHTVKNDEKRNTLIQKTMNLLK